MFQTTNQMMILFQLESSAVKHDLSNLQDLLGFPTSVTGKSKVTSDNNGQLAAWCNSERPWRQLG